MDLTNRFDPSTALAAILSCDPENIITRTPPDLPPYLLLEALAQTCGMHLRFRRHFLVDVFLASATDLVYKEHPAPITIRARQFPFRKPSILERYKLPKKSEYF